MPGAPAARNSQAGGKDLPLLCLVGNRTGALRAAHAIGASVLLLSPAAPRTAPALAAHFPWQPDEGETALPRLARQLSRWSTPAAVIPLSERAVVVAASLAARLGVPGPDTDSARHCTDKLLMKSAARRAGVACADFLAGHEYGSAENALRRLGLPLVIKRHMGSGGRGLYVFRKRREVPAALSPEQIAERYVRGVECSVESLVADGRPVWTNVTEYLERHWANIVPLALPADRLDALRALNRKVITALGVSGGITHMECFLTPDGPVFGELAWRPPGGYLMPLIRDAYGFDPWEALFELWLGRRRGRLPPRPAGFAGVRLLHPGPGMLKAVHGLDAARRVPGVSGIQLRYGPGQSIPARLGAGDDAGWIRATGPDRESVVRALAGARRALRFHLRPVRVHD